MKTTILKTAFAAVLIFSAMALVTCQPELLPEDAGGPEYTDVVYEYTGAGNDVRIKSVKLYLDGVKVQRSAAARKLDLEAARMGHDFFEVVFRGGNGTVARAQWEIGQLAGISGVWRNTPTGVNYATVTPTPASTDGSAAIFVGRKSSKTLLGVGYLTHINDGLGTTINDATRSVIFTVAPLQTWVGFSAADTLILRTINGGTTGGDTVTFTTATTAAFVDAAPTRTYSAVSNTTSKGNNVALRTGALFPRFELPSVRNLPDTITSVVIPAVYTVGGLAADATISKPALYDAIRTWGVIGGNTAVDRTGHTTGSSARGGLQFIKRTPAFMYQGTTYGLATNDDKVTKVDLTTPTTADQSFIPTMALTITQYRQSSGAFAITFQQPVYLLTVKNSDNGGLEAEKWFVRPDYGQYQYLLDNGVDSGGAVLLVTDLTGGTEWIEIKTTGIGFDNE